MPSELKVPTVGESITEVQVGEWRKQEGERVERDESIVELESEKATFDLPAPVSGVIAKILKRAGETAKVGEVICQIEEQAAGKSEAPRESKGGGEKKGAGESKPARESKTAEREPAAREEKGSRRVMPAAERVLHEKGLKAEQVEATGPGGRLLKEDVQRHSPKAPADSKEDSGDKAAPGEEAHSEQSKPASPASGKRNREEQVLPMSLIRKRIAERLVQAQQQAALLTTFNEVDMTEVAALRTAHQTAFQEKHGVKLGFMSFFVKAAVDALSLFPAVNAEIRGTNVVYRNYADIGIAVGGGKGLVVPVLRDAGSMSFAEIEKAVADFGKRAKDNQLKPDELQGGTFTITNGGIYGSLMSTPIVNPPQSGVLGMHAIQERPVARNGQVVIRPMMYIALTYDHRIVDGREAVTFLKRIKETIEEPARILLEV